MRFKALPAYGLQPASFFLFLIIYILYPHLSQNILGETRVTDVGVLAALNDSSLCGYTKRRGISLPDVGWRSGLPVRRQSVHTSGFKNKAMYSCSATLLIASPGLVAGK